MVTARETQRVEHSITITSALRVIKHLDRNSLFVVVNQNWFR